MKDYAFYRVFWRVECWAAVSPTDKSRRNGTLSAVASEKASYPPSVTFAVIPLIIERIHFFKVGSAGRGTYYVLTHKQDINRA